MDLVRPAFSHSVRYMFIFQLTGRFNATISTNPTGNCLWSALYRRWKVAYSQKEDDSCHGRRLLPTSVDGEHYTDHRLDTVTSVQYRPRCLASRLKVKVKATATNAAMAKIRARTAMR